MAPTRWHPRAGEGYHTERCPTGRTAILKNARLKRSCQCGKPSQFNVSICIGRYIFIYLRVLVASAENLVNSM